MDTQEVDVFRVTMRGPADISGLIELIENRALDPHDIVAILGKTGPFLCRFTRMSFVTEMVGTRGCGACARGINGRFIASRPKQ